MTQRYTPKVEAARDFAKRFKRSHVVILSLSNKTIEYAGYGDTKKRCNETRQLAEIAYNAIWHFLKSGGLKH